MEAVVAFVFLVGLILILVYGVVWIFVHFIGKDS